eukprot:NODE_2752_length_881_cov_409.309927.p2 GENE.NODE_2752_length_881_cov_409.309927~~NODE_2752_length_881_cov_409.309927.p2  ORF type:complete len:215 (+),score=78.26 NODE_2752_length_881_cov_409.309927:3-647(+)
MGFTLYKCITGGHDWGDMMAPMENIGLELQAIASIYITFCTLVVFNTVTGVFVERAHQVIQRDSDHMVMEELANRATMCKDLAKILVSINKDSTGSLSVDDFEKYVEDDRVQAYFRRLGLHVENDNARALFELIDFDGDGYVRVEEFIDGCAQMVGTARQLDIARLRHGIFHVLEDVEELAVLVKARTEQSTHARQLTESAVDTKGLPQFVVSM